MNSPTPPIPQLTNYFCISIVETVIASPFSSPVTFTAWPAVGSRQILVVLIGDLHHLAVDHQDVFRPAADGDGPACTRGRA